MTNTHTMAAPGTLSNAYCQAIKDFQHAISITGANRKDSEEAHPLLLEIAKELTGDQSGTNHLASNKLDFTVIGNTFVIKGDVLRARSEKDIQRALHLNIPAGETSGYTLHIS